MYKFTRSLFHNFWQNIITCFSGYYLLCHLLAISSTYLIVISGFDWVYFISTRNTTLNTLLFPAVIIGAFTPIILPLIILGVGALSRNAKTVNTGFALTQAAILGSLISSFYKIFTGRIPPNLHNTAVDISRNFQFGFWRGGIFWGWPSSHTTAAFAMAMTLALLYPRNKKVAVIALLYALYIGIGISVNIHWFSEFVAGMCIGSAIGIVVAKSFRERLKQSIAV